MTKRPVFILKHINMQELDQKYQLVPPHAVEEVPTNTTKIDDLPTPSGSFLEESRKYTITMMDSVAKKSIQTGLNCFWCRHPFPNTPVGCPLKYVPNTVTQTHVSEITKERYYIQQQITSLEYNAKIPTTTDETTSAKYTHHDYYETDGCFCSFNCCVAFINDNIHNPVYAQSKALLMKMIAGLNGLDAVEKLTPAPSWRLLSMYGGTMDIQTFRDSFTIYRYDDMEHILSEIPRVSPVGHLFQEHYILL
jgi:hypothetical protein